MKQDRLELAWVRWLLPEPVDERGARLEEPGEIFGAKVFADVGCGVARSAWNATVRPEIGEPERGGGRFGKELEVQAGRRTRGEIEAFRQRRQVYPWKQRSDARSHVRGVDADSKKTGQRRPVVCTVDLQPMVLELPKDVEERTLEMRLILHRSHAGRLERQPKPEALLQADLDAACALACAKSVGGDEHVQVRVGETKREQSERVRHANDGARSDATSCGARDQRPVIREAKRDVMPDGIVRVEANLAGRKSSALPRTHSVGGHRRCPLQSYRPGTTRSCVDHDRKLQE